MNRILVVILCLSLAVCMAACAANNDSTESVSGTAPIDGGWTTAQPAPLTEEQTALFERAMEGMTGASYTPVLYLGSQVVAGTNYRFFCQSQPTYPGAPETYVIVEVYEDLEKNANVTSVTDLTPEDAVKYLEQTGNHAQIANPFVPFDNMEEAAALAGFSMELAQEVSGYPNRMIEAVKDELIQVFYATGNMAEDGTEYVLFRKGVGSEDISGDYNVYVSVTNQEADDKTVTLKGDGKQVNLAVWTDGNYSYSIFASIGMTADAMMNLVNTLK